MKLCRDCKWFKHTDDSCGHPEAEYVEPVRGRIMYYSARVVRESRVTTDCGPDAQYFQPKLSEAA